MALPSHFLPRWSSDRDPSTYASHIVGIIVVPQHSGFFFEIGLASNRNVPISTYQEVEPPCLALLFFCFEGFFFLTRSHYIVQGDLELLIPP
jgi:hypothetical protein